MSTDRTQGALKEREIFDSMVANAKLELETKMQKIYDLFPQFRQLPGTGVLERVNNAFDSKYGTSNSIRAEDRRTIQEFIISSIVPNKNLYKVPEIVEAFLSKYPDFTEKVKRAKISIVVRTFFNGKRKNFKPTSVPSEYKMLKMLEKKSVLNMRDTVLSILSESKVPLTYEEIVEILKKKMPDAKNPENNTSQALLIGKRKGFFDKKYEQDTWKYFIKQPAPPLA